MLYDESISRLPFWDRDLRDQLRVEEAAIGRGHEGDVIRSIRRQAKHVYYVHARLGRFDGRFIGVGFNWTFEGKPFGHIPFETDLAHAVLDYEANWIVREVDAPKIKGYMPHMVKGEKLARVTLDDGSQYEGYLMDWVNRNGRIPCAGLQIALSKYLINYLGLFKQWEYESQMQSLHSFVDPAFHHLLDEPVYYGAARLDDPTGISQQMEKMIEAVKKEADRNVTQKARQMGFTDTTTRQFLEKAQEAGLEIQLPPTPPKKNRLTDIPFD